MTQITRSLISSGAYAERLQCHARTPWTQEKIQDSLDATLRRRPPSVSRDVWIFAYGSLMWNPLLNFDQRQTAYLAGWHRSFCLRLTVGRGTEETPGRMLAVERGGCTSGVALRIPEEALSDELAVVWTREMIFGSYRPLWTPITFADGSGVSAITFTAAPTGWQYEDDSSVEKVAPLIAAACGPFGSNAEYLFSLKQALSDCGLQDDYVTALSDEVAGMRNPQRAQHTGRRQKFPLDCLPAGHKDPTKSMFIK